MSDKAPNRIDQIAIRWKEDAFVTKPSSVPDVLYHYTDAAGLVGMLQNGRIWATDYRFLNDRSEIDHTRSRAKELARTKLAENIRPPLQDFYAKVAELIELEIPDDVFVFSFSEESDDLSQWRGYAREGMGFTIGFSGQALCDAAGRPDAEYSFFRIEYDHRRQMAAIERALSEMEAEFSAQAAREDADVAALCAHAADSFVWIANNRSVANKHKSFYSEKEWRIMGAVPGADRPEDVRTRASGFRLVNYVELNLPTRDSPRLPILRIGIGPGFQGSEEAHAVRALCEKARYDVDLYFADTPYRRV